MNIFLLIIIVAILIGAPIAFLLDKKDLKVLSLEDLKVRVKRNKRNMIYLFIVFLIVLGLELWTYIQYNHALFVILLMPLGTMYFHWINIVFLKHTIKQKEREVTDIKQTETE